MRCAQRVPPVVRLPMRRASSLRLGGALLALLSGLLLAGPESASAQDLSDRSTERCTRAAVRIQVDIPGGSSTGSGSIIDPRGYVLTNFHVVGFTRHGEHGLPGELMGDGQHITIATVTSARDTATPRYLARVVRADIRLDLALLRITGNADGSALAAGTTFPTVELATTEGLQPGASLWAFGFPLGVRTINVTGGHMTGFQMSSRGEVAWVRTDAEFNPGNSGGMLVDRRGRLVAVPTAVVSGSDTLEPIELARPVERIPSAWSTALAAGHIDDIEVTGIQQLVAGQDVTDESVGDAGGLEAPDVFYYRLPAERPGVVTVTPSMPVGLISSRGSAIREGRGSVVIGVGDGSAVVAILVPRAEDGSSVQVRVRYEQQAPMAMVPPQYGGGVPPYAMGAQPQPYGMGVQPYGGTPPQYGGVPQPYGMAGAVTIRGRMVDASTGQGVAGMVLIGQPGVDLQSHVMSFLAGRMTEAAFQSRLVGLARTDPQGFYEIRGVPRGSYPGAGMSAGYRPAMLTVSVTPADMAVIDVNPIQLAR